MQKITRGKITELLENESTPKVTLYIPLEATASPPHITENQIRLKNLIHKAMDELSKRDDGQKLSKQLEEILNKYFDDLEFWKEARRGILLCAAPDLMEMFRLPIDTEEYVAVDDGFHLAPVLALLEDGRDFYVLTLAQQNPKIYQGDMYGLKQLDIGLPATLRAGLGIDEPNQKSENQGSAVGTSMQPGWFNGRGGARDPMDNDRLKFFHLIDGILHDKLDRSIPLLLGGIESETVEFRNLSKYPKILNGFVAGNHKDCEPASLFEEAMPIITKELVQPDHEAAREEYERLAGANPERVAGDKASIEAAAKQGRVDKLLAALSRDTTDTVQDKVKSVIRITFPESGQYSRTLNNLATQVWQMSGKVINLLPAEMPSGAPMVARLRY